MFEHSHNSLSETFIANEQEVGAALFLARKSKGWTVRSLAKQSGLSIGMISQIERGLSFPSLKSLTMLASALNLDVANFLRTPVTTRRRSNSIYVFRQKVRQKPNLTPTGLTKRDLYFDIPGINMFEIKLDVGGNSGHEFFLHKGENAGVVLSGRMQLWINNEPTLLESGDSFRFPATLPNRFNNPSITETHLIWLTISTKDHHAVSAIERSK
ncbi:helix-turn-helix domain-containing protein [Brucella pseudogrignonensis]|uniref:helix-turn-helix domain-containing protein n=1 Tax=Brucella pseudogrignonensis TaxID=419475 RepID=UPI003D999A42